MENKLSNLELSLFSFADSIFKTEAISMFRLIRWWEAMLNLNKLAKATTSNPVLTNK